MAELLERTILDYHSQGKFLLHAFVIMPDHSHPNPSRTR
jgi:putative transposase